MTLVGFDTETKGLDWTSPEERAFLGQWATAGGEWHAVASDREASAAYLAALARADTIVAHNLSFDVHQTRATWGLDVMALGKELHDTDLISRILFPEGQRKDRGGHGLKNLATVYLRADAQHYEDRVAAAAKEIGLRSLKRPGAYYDVWRAFPKVLEEYGRMDARFTHDLLQDFLPRFKSADPRLWKLYQLEMQVAPHLIEAERKGTRVDPDGVARLKRHYTQQKQTVGTQLERELGFLPEGEGTEEQLTEALQMIGVPLHKTTEKTNKLSVARDALQEFEGDFPVIKDLFEFRRINKFLSTYVAPMEGRETVHPSFLQCEAWTGRTACRRPNMQNLPKRRDTDQEENLRVRSMYVPREEYVFIVADYEGIEMRLLAYFMGVPSYKRLYLEGLDPHAFTASVVWGGKPEEYGKDTAKRIYRDIAKHTTFAIVYGAGGPKVMETINRMVPEEYRITLPEARRIIHRIKDALKGYRGLTSRVREKVQSVGHVNTLMGRRQVVPPDKHYVGVNALIQGSAADIMKQGLVNVAESVEAFGAYPLLVVHDEVVVECPAEEAQAALPVVVRALRGAWELDPPLEVEASITEVSYAHA